MQRKKWISGLCIAMAAALVFTGCGHKKSSREEKGTTVSSGTVVMMVGDDQVRYSEVMAYCYFLKCQYEDSFGKELWQYKLDDNETIGDQAKQEIVNMITQLKVISDVAQQQEVSLSADEQDEALRQAESLVQNAKAADKKEYGLSVQKISEIYQENLLAEKMFYVATDEADTNVTDEEASEAIRKEAAKTASGSALQTEEDISITQHTHPLLTICANSLCRSLDSGVVCPAFFTSFPLYVHIVPTMPVLYPASFKIPAVRNAVVVFPFVPVTPMTFISSAG